MYFIEKIALLFVVILLNTRPQSLEGLYNVLGEHNLKEISNIKLYHQSFPNKTGKNYLMTVNLLENTNEGKQNKVLYFVSFSLFLLLFTGGFIVNKKYIKERNQAKEQLNNLKLHVLQLKMNPHFIFNGLNSIQRYITDNDPEKAIAYLSDFACLIRLTFENSEKERISIQEEVAFLELYLKMESLRFKNKFKSKVTVDDNIPLKEIKIPPMIIQPYVENAIKHGLIHQKQGGGFVSIRFLLEANGLKIIIEDNGVGIHSSIKNKENTLLFSCLGMKTTKNRLSIINSGKSTYFGVKAEDLSEINRSLSGTRITITLPCDLKKQNYELPNNKMYNC